MCIQPQLGTFFEDDAFYAGIWLIGLIARMYFRLNVINPFYCHIEGIVMVTYQVEVVVSLAFRQISFLAEVSQMNHISGIAGFCHFAVFLFLIMSCYLYIGGAGGACLNL